MGTKKTGDIVYEAEVIVCNCRTVEFKRAAAQGIECLNRIKTNGYSLNGHVADDNLTIDTLACPIRVYSIEQLRNTGDDWCKYGSPIDEIYYENIPRWWPKDWLYNEDGSLPKEFEFRFAGENIGKLNGRTLVVRCKVIKYDRSMAESFGDIHIDGLDDIEYRPESVNLVDDMIVDDININHIEDVDVTTTIYEEDSDDEIVVNEKQIDEEEGKDMLFGKKEKEVETKVVEAVETPVMETVVETKNTQPVEEVIETPKAKVSDNKKTNYKKPLIIGVTATAAIAGLALIYVKFIKK